MRKAFIDGYLWEIGFAQKSGYFWINDIYFFNSLIHSNLHPTKTIIIVPEEFVVNVTPQLRMSIFRNLRNIREKKLPVIKNDSSEVQPRFLIQEALLPRGVSIPALLIRVNQEI